MTPLETTKWMNNVAYAAEFFGNRFKVEFRKHTPLDSKGNIRDLADYIDLVLGEYNYYTALNKCYVTLAEAIKKGYLYTRNGRPRKMETEAVLEWVYYHNPHLDHQLDLEEVDRLRKAYLESDEIYPFFKVDTVDVNVFRRMTRKGSPIRYMSKNLQHLHKRKNGHLQGSEDLTRKVLYNTYLSLIKLWEMQIVPVVEMVEIQESSAMNEMMNGLESM